MTHNEIRDRLLELARVRLKNRFGAFEQFRFTVDSLPAGAVIMGRAGLMPAAWTVGLSYGLDEAAKQIDAHLLRIIDEWAQRESPARQIPALEGVQPLAAEPQAEAPSPAPVMTESASNAPVDGITTAQVAGIFDALPFTAENWTKRLSDTKWLEPARAALGAAGGPTSLWNPATLARLIQSRQRGAAKQKTLEALNRKFTGNPELAPWRNDWNEYYEMFNDADGSR